MSNFDQQEIDAVIAEAEYAFQKWGTAFDDNNTLNDWVTYISMYATEAAKIDNKAYPITQYEKLIKAANLALTAAKRIRTGTIALRHYDALATLTDEGPNASNAG